MKQGFTKKKCWALALGLLSTVLAISALPVRAAVELPSPPGMCCPGYEDRGGGGGGQPDGLSFFNQRVELADGEYYLLKGHIVIAPALMGSSRKQQAYLKVD